MGISLENAELVSLALTTFLYGLFFALFLITIVVMSYKVTEDIRRQRTRILPASLMMLLVATTHLIIIWIRAMQGFVVQKRGSTQAFYEDISDPTSIIKLTCMCLQTVLGDLVIIWRLYVVYDKNIIAIVPAILLVASYSAVAIVTISLIARAHTGTDIFHVATSWITAYFSLTMSTNVICSGAIAWRIFFVGKPLGRSTSLWPIIFVIIESSALYALGVIAALVSFLSNTNGQYAAVDATVPLVGIVFSLIVLQIRFHISATASYWSDGNPTTRTAVCQWVQPSSFPANGEELEFPARPQSIQMAVHVTKQTHTHVSSRSDSMVTDPSPDFKKSAIL
ncbi:hypothetical protein BJV78DRAFT_1134832 [Lactifluus subvellereus]|nr:hypothetical protein BJV78DRAFT_1134832 [Lactifluus subvellereus]